MFLHRGFFVENRIALFTYSLNHHLNCFGFIPRRNGHCWRNHFVKAKGSIALAALKMHVMVVVMAFFTIIFTKSVFN